MLIRTSFADKNVVLFQWDQTVTVTKQSDLNIKPYYIRTC